MKDYIKLNKKIYDQLAQEYKLKLKKYRVSDRIIAKPFINYLNKTFNKIRVLELGSGSGLNLSFFEKEKFNTSAIDISQKIIAVSKEVAPKTKFIHSEFMEYNFKNLKYEGIFAKAFIHLFPKKDAIIVMKKVLDLLVPKGAVFLATTIHSKSEEGLFKKKDYKKQLVRFRKRWIETELLKEIKKIGYKIISKDYHIESDSKKKWINLVLVKKHS